MTKKILSSIIFIAIIFIDGCFEKEPIRQNGVFVIWKTPMMKYADQGFLYENEESVKLEIYSSGQAALSLTIDDGEICSGLLCMNKREFNRRYLSPLYPDDTIENILKGEEIFSGEGKESYSEGFKQHIVSVGRYDIEYICNKNSVLFNDKINDITIRIKRMEEI